MEGFFYMSIKSKLSRRDFLKLTGATLFGLATVWGLPHMQNEFFKKFESIPAFIPGATQPRISNATDGESFFSYQLNNQIKTSFINYKGEIHYLEEIELPVNEKVTDHTWSPNNNAIAYSTPSRLFAIDSEGNTASIKQKVASSLSWGKAGITFSDGEKIHIWQPETNDLSQFNNNGVSVAWSRDCGKIAISTQNNFLSVMRDDKTIIKDLGNATFLSWKGMNIIAVLKDSRLKLIDVSDESSDFEIPLDTGAIIPKSMDFFIRDFATILSSEGKLYLLTINDSQIDELNIESRLNTQLVNEDHRSQFEIKSSLWLGQTGMLAVETNEGIQVIQIITPTQIQHPKPPFLTS